VLGTFEPTKNQGISDYYSFLSLSLLFSKRKKKFKTNLAAGCLTLIVFKIVAPSFVITTSFVPVTIY